MATLNGADPTFAAKVNALIAASGGRVTLVSGVRDRAKQAALYAAALAKYGSPAIARKWVAPPGHSNHEKGKAVDFGGDLALAHKLAPAYGLHFPLANESWHAEPVGSRSDAPASNEAAWQAVDSRQAPDSPTTAPAATPEPGAERKDLGVQIGAFLSILERPVDFEGVK